MGPSVLGEILGMSQVMLNWKIEGHKGKPNGVYLKAGKHKFDIASVGLLFEGAAAYMQS